MTARRAVCRKEEKMTNEEKSKSIAEKFKAAYEPYYSSEGLVETSEIECYDSAMQMAEWKDNQAADAYCKCCNECRDYGIDICNKLEDFMTIMKGGKN